MRPLLVALLVSVPALARADQATLEVHAGIGAPFGDLAASLEYAPDPHFAAGFGGGIAPGGAQMALMGRYRFGSEGWRFGLGAGAAAGGYRWHEFTFDEPAVKQWDIAYWASGEASVEKRSSDLRVRVYVGVSRVLNPDDGVCVEAVEHCEMYHRDSGLTVPYVGVALGYVWDL
jgi:hypothetical protein